MNFRSADLGTWEELKAKRLTLRAFTPDWVPNHQAMTSGLTVIIGVTADEQHCYIAFTSHGVIAMYDAGIRQFYSANREEYYNMK